MACQWFKNVVLLAGSVGLREVNAGLVLPGVEVPSAEGVLGPELAGPELGPELELRATAGIQEEEPPSGEEEQQLHAGTGSHQMSSLYKGISWDGTKQAWTACTYVGSTRINIGWDFGNQHAAAAAYNAVVVLYKGPDRSELNQLSTEALVAVEEEAAAANIEVQQARARRYQAHANRATAWLHSRLDRAESLLALAGPVGGAEEALAAAGHGGLLKQLTNALSCGALAVGNSLIGSLLASACSNGTQFLKSCCKKRSRAAEGLEEGCDDGVQACQPQAASAAASRRGFKGNRYEGVLGLKRMVAYAGFTGSGNACMDVISANIPGLPSKRTSRRVVEGANPDPSWQQGFSAPHAARACKQKVQRLDGLLPEGEPIPLIIKLDGSDLQVGGGLSVGWWAGTYDAAA